MNGLLAIVPPYRHRHCPPAGAAALLGHLKANGIASFRFLDLRLVTPDALTPTFNPVGLFGESFVIDVPDLPLVLRLLRAFGEREAVLTPPSDAAFQRYCLLRQMDPRWLHGWCRGMEEFLRDSLSHLPNLAFVGFSVWSSNLFTTLLAAAILKAREDAPFVVLGGPQVSESAHSGSLALESGLADAVVLGEGESALLEIIRRRQCGHPVTGLKRVRVPSTHASPGREIRDDQTARPLKPPRKLIFARPPEAGPLLKLDQLAKPDFDAMDLRAYKTTAGQWRLPFQLSRGCTDRCAFCSEWTFWERYRIDTVAHALDQIEALRNDYEISAFHFTDSLINGHMRRLREFAEGVVSRGLQIDWGGFMRADMDEETATLIRSAGCSYAYIGVESFSDDTLEAMNKRRTRADNIRAIEAFLDAGIRVSVGVIPGFPGDTRDRFFETILHLAELSERYKDRFGFNVEPFVASPGQPIYRDLEEFGLTEHRWDETVLGIAPAYRGITEKIPCHVTGANQGVERMGQLRLLEILSGNNSERGYVRERLPSNRVQFVNIGVAVLAKVKERGRVVGRLVSETEKQLLSDAAQKADETEHLVENSDFRKHWAAVAGRHAWPPSTLLLPTRTVRRIERDHHLYIPGHVIGRVIKTATGPRLLVVNILTEETLELPMHHTSLLRQVATAQAGFPATSEHAFTFAPPLANTSTILHALLERGMVCVVDRGHIDALGQGAK